MASNYKSQYHGTVFKVACPVCDSPDIVQEWRIPMTTIDPPTTLFGGYFNQVPTLKSPFTIFGFDLCKVCESVFLNPDIPRENQIKSYKASTHYIRKMENKDEWRGYVERYQLIKKYVVPGSTAMIDAASGLGQVALLAKDDKEFTWRRIASLELSDPYVKHMKENGIESYQFDIDNDSIEKVFEKDSFDFIVFFEAFEHVSYPTKALLKLLWPLKPGGRLFFSAQRYGDDVNLAIRPGEPIYIGETYLASLGERVNCKIIDVIRNGSRYFVVLEKLGEKAGFVPPATKQEIHSRVALRQIKLSGHFSREGQFCWVADLAVHCPGNADQLAAIADTDEMPQRSSIRLFERSGGTSVELKGAHSLHDAIRNVGKGRFSHWKKDLYFSTSDNTDPNRNGREYFIEL